MVKFFRNRIVFYQQALKQAREVGAGTGALSHPIAERLRSGDQLDLYEINPAFIGVLREDLARIRGPSIEIHEGDIRGLPEGRTYDAIVSSLPLLNMAPHVVREIFELLVARLEPEGTWSYYDYWGKEVRRVMGGETERRRVKDVLRVTAEFLDRYEYRRILVPWNFPPGCVHYLRRR